MFLVRFAIGFFFLLSFDSVEMTSKTPHNGTHYENESATSNRPIKICINSNMSFQQTFNRQKNTPITLEILLKSNFACFKRLLKFATNVLISSPIFGSEKVAFCFFFLQTIVENSWHIRAIYRLHRPNYTPSNRVWVIWQVTSSIKHVSLNDASGFCTSLDLHRLFSTHVNANVVMINESQSNILQSDSQARGEINKQCNKNAK